jgi:hypothetical protein
LVAESIAAEVAVAPKYFPPQTVALSASEQVMPLLTPDNYADHVIPLIRSAKRSIRFQNQYITISAKSNPAKFMALLAALRGRIDSGVDVKIILRDLGHARDMVESLHGSGFDPDKHVKFTPTCHNKGIIVDDAVVCIGSHNWSGQGTCFNRDASLIFENAAIAGYFAKIFDYDWSWARQVLASESTTPQLATGAGEPEGSVRVPWDAYFGDDYRIDEALSRAQTSVPSSASSFDPRITMRSPLDIANPLHPTLHAAKARLSAHYLTSDRAIAYSKHAQGISPVPEINVIGVGLGEMITQNAPTGITAVKLFVRKKYPKEFLAASHMLPSEIDGVPVDVEEIGEIRPQAAFPDPRTQFTPAQPGCSVGFQYPKSEGRMAGTFGAVVRDAKGVRYLLSNNHVLADESQLKAGALIYQCGLLDLMPDMQPRPIARLSRFSDFTSLDLKVDAAIAEAIAPGILSPDILYIGAPQGIEPAATDMTVHKFGRTSFYTVGRVTSVATDVTIDYETGSYTFRDQIIVEGRGGQSFSGAGDSGSLIVNRKTSKAIGLLCAGSTSHTIANHIADVLTAMGVDLA